MNGLASGTRLQTRLFWVDNLRNVAVLSLVLFHTARLFDPEPWHIKDRHTYLAADVVVALFNVWGMPMLFLLAGFSMMLSLERRSAGRFAGERVTRLFVPFVFGIFALVLPQVYLERIAPADLVTQSPLRLDVGFIDFLPRFFDCCYDKANFSWHHLWFLIYLFVYSLVLLPVFLALRSAAGRPLRGAFSAGFANLPMLLLLGLPLIVTEARLRPRYGSSHALVGDWANHAHFAWLMLVGALLALTEAPRAEIRRRFPVLAGLAALLIVTALFHRFVTPLPMTRLTWTTLRTMCEWVLLLALIGGFARFDRRVPWLTGFTPYAMAFYMLHQTIIIALGFLTIGWSDAPLSKYLAIVISTTAVSLALAALIDRHPVSRFLFGMAGKRRR
ncbi:acyltransferase family protein [Pleomorphomonas sp. NRK KF1]|uniref:acyltransferase family protein n=1 Tax=Pleomorphomonas sp. NRK KF1 TaxID=2943000 RepID=UPI0020438BAC|nr:acyltransferase family protein [Pleomorphomonas sp. NRK KF1]MCM5553997.1 acyltransferase family protein [Pleomorphomonas sp. NRK KF1]